MTMKDGIKVVVNATLDVKDEICTRMIDAGVDPKEAVKASSVVTKDEVEGIIDKVLGNQDAASFTHNLSQIGKGKKPVS